jgi:hypothetical protein
MSMKWYFNDYSLIKHIWKCSKFCGVLSQVDTVDNNTI